MTKNAHLLQYAKQTEPVYALWHFVFCEWAFFSLYFTRTNFCDELNLVSLVLFLNVLWIQDVYKLKGFFFYKFSTKPGIE